MTTRREFAGAIAAGLLSVPMAGMAQQPGRVYRLGILAPTAPDSSDPTPFRARLVAKLGQLGYAEGKNLVIEQRYGKGKPEKLPGLARELVQARVEVIVAIAGSSVRAAKQATTTLPIVMLGSFDPVADGVVASLARPGGNVTGVLLPSQATLAHKKVELLTEAVPRITRIAFLAPSDAGTTAGQLQEVERAAGALGIEVSAVRVKGTDYAAAFVAIAALHPQALFVAASRFLLRDRKAIIDLAAKYRLPAIYEWREQVQDGGLMAYGSSHSWTAEHVAAMVDRILKGAKPGDLPVEQPDKFDLVINLKTAKALGLTLPPAMLAQANEAIR